MGHPHMDLEFGISEKKPDKPLKPARSEAELTRVRQGRALIFINCVNVCLTLAVVLKTFGLI